MFGVGVIALRGDKRRATRMSFGLLEWVIGLLGSTSLFQPKMRQATASWGWVCERRIGFKTPYPFPTRHILDKHHWPRRWCFSVSPPAVWTVVSETVGSVASPGYPSLLFNLSDHGRGLIRSMSPVRCICMWPEFRVRRELNLPPLPPRSYTTSPAPPCQLASFIPFF